MFDLGINIQIFKLHSLGLVLKWYLWHTCFRSLNLIKSLHCLGVQSRKNLAWPQLLSPSKLNSMHLCCQQYCFKCSSRQVSKDWQFSCSQIIGADQSKSPPISISSSSALGSSLGLAFSAGFSAGLAAYLAGFSAAGAGAELPPETAPKNSLMFLPERALTTAPTRLALAVTLAAARTALTESTVTAAPWAESTKAAQLTASCSFQAMNQYQLLKQSIIAFYQQMRSLRKWSRDGFRIKIGLAIWTVVTVCVRKQVQRSIRQRVRFGQLESIRLASLTILCFFVL